MDHIGVKDSLEGLEVEPFAHCMSCSSHGRSCGASPAEAHPMHHLERGLVGDGRAGLGAQAHGHPPVAAAVVFRQEDLSKKSIGN